MFSFNSNPTLTSCQEQALEVIKSGKNLYLTGAAGTGKTFLLKSLRRILGKDLKGLIYYTATTGMASLNYDGGRTVSSFLGLGLYTPETITYNCRYTFDSHDIIVIDEIFILGKSQFQLILNSIKINSEKGEMPQIIVAGDPAQGTSVRWETPIGEEDLSGFEHIDLQSIVRQTNKNFISRLNFLRENPLNSEILDFFRKKQGNKSEKGVRLVATRADMDEYNLQIAEQFKDKIKLTSDLREITDPDKLYNKLELWVGAKVLMKENSYSYGSIKYVNGDTAVVKKIDSDGSVKVKIDRTGATYWVYPNYRTYVITPEVLGKKNKVIKPAVMGEYKYYPILLCYALSKGQSQGLTIAKGIIDESVLTADRATQYTIFSRFPKMSSFKLDF